VKLLLVIINISNQHVKTKIADLCLYRRTDDLHLFVQAHDKILIINSKRKRQLYSPFSKKIDILFRLLGRLEKYSLRYSQTEVPTGRILSTSISKMIDSDDWFTASITTNKQKTPIHRTTTAVTMEHTD
jgi:hypothetical protein